MISAPGSGHSSLGRTTRRECLAGGAALLLSGCNASVAANTVNAVRLLMAGPPDAPVTRSYVANLPYASIRARIGDSGRAFLVLGHFDGADLHWISADRAAIVTRNGRIVRTAGIGVDLRDTRDIDDDPVAAATFEFEGVHRRTVDLDPPRRYGVPIESHFEVVGRETVTILGESYDTLHVRENNSARSLRWRFANDYWFDFTTGFVWKTTQHFVPDVPPAEIEVLKRLA